MEKFEKELARGQLCDPAAAGKHWYQFQVAVNDRQRRLGSAVQKLANVTGFFVDFDKLAGYYRSGRCGSCCGSEMFMGMKLVSDIIDEGGQSSYR